MKCPKCKTIINVYGICGECSFLDSDDYKKSFEYACDQLRDAGLELQAALYNRFKPMIDAVAALLRALT